MATMANIRQYLIAHKATLELYINDQGIFVARVVNKAGLVEFFAASRYYGTAIEILNTDIKLNKKMGK